MPLRAFSIGMITDVTISSGLAPGSWSPTFTVAGSARGNKSTPRSRNGKMPRTTSEVTSMVAKTGRRTQISESIGLLRLSLLADRDLLSVGEVVHVGQRHAVAGLQARHDLHALVPAV